jgi:hypothetical protein
MKYFLFIISIFLCHHTIAQSVFSGQIIDSQTEEKLAYVNIGIIGKNIGTVSDLDGNFSLDFDENYNMDTLRISMVGYETKDFVVSEFQKMINDNPTVKLNQQSVDIKEIVISSRQLKTKVLGNKTTSQNISAGFMSNDLGNEIGIKIKIKRSPSYIKDFNVSIVENVFDTVRFRLNFYSIKNGIPDKNLNFENIIVETNIKNGILTVDLEKYNIVVEDDFYVTMEWIEDFGDAETGLMFSANFFNKKIVARATSQGNWKKLGVVSVGMNVTVDY